jgi:hypothetical protein
MILNDLLLYRLLADLIRELHTLLLQLFKIFTTKIKNLHPINCI